MQFRFTAKGFLIKNLRYGEFDVEDKKVFQISDLNNTTDILKDIDKYNDGKPLCIMAQKQIRDMENETRHNTEETYKQYKEMKDAKARFSKHEDKELFSIPKADEKRLEKMFRVLHDVKNEEDFKLKSAFYTYKSDEDTIISKYYNKNNQYYKYPFLSDEEREKIKNNIDVPKLIKKNAQLKTLKMIEDMKQFDCTTEEQLQSIYKIIVNDFNGNIEEAGEDISIMLYNPLEIEEAEKDDKSEYVFFTEEILRAFYKNMNNDQVKTLQTIRRAEEFTRLLALITNFGYYHEKYCKDEIRNDTYKQNAYEFLGALDVYLYELSKYDYWNFKEYFDVSRDEISKLKKNLYSLKKFYNNLLANPLGATIGFFLRGF